MIYESEKINEAPQSSNQNFAYGNTILTQSKESRFGGGLNVFKTNKEGVFAGSDTFSTAPFSVDYNGNTNTSYITASGGQITGDLMVGSPSGFHIIIKGSIGQFTYYKGSSLAGYNMADSNSNMLYIANYSHNFFDKNNHYIGRLFHDSSSIYGLELQGGSTVQFTSGRSIYDTSDSLTINGGLKFSGGTGFISWASGRGIIATGSSIQINGDLTPSSNYGNDCGTDGNFWNNIRAGNFYSSSNYHCQGQDGIDMNAYGFLTNVRLNGNQMQGKYIELTMKGGIFTNKSNESGWTNIG